MAKVELYLTSGETTIIEAREFIRWSHKQGLEPWPHDDNGYMINPAHIIKLKMTDE